MSYCLNPACPSPQNADDVEVCQCGVKLRLNDRYMAIRPIGQGGFSRTFLAVDLAQSNKPRCVIKQFFPNLGIDRATASDLFREEADRLKHLDGHPQIPDLLDYLEQENQQYLIQEFIDGQNLEQELNSRGAFNETEIRQLLVDLLPILQFMHDRQVIHRDIKPANIIRRASDQKLVLVDLGAAKYANGTALVRTGTVIGSAEYTAPEQARGRAVFGSDIYSLGATCIHLMTQISPFDLFDTSVNRWAWRNCLKHPINQSLDRILHKMLEDGTSRRYQTANQVLADLTTSQPAAKLAFPVADYSETQSDSSHPPIDRRGELISTFEPETRSWRRDIADTEIADTKERSVLVDSDVKFDRAGSMASADVNQALFDPNQKSLGRGFKFWAAATLVVFFSIAIASWWQMRDRLIRTIAVGDSVESIAITPDGKTIASSIAGDAIINETTASRIELLNLQTGESIKEWDIRSDLRYDPLGSTYSIYLIMNEIAITPDGKTLVGGGESETVRLWNLQTGALIATRSLSQSVSSETITQMALSPDGTSLATSSASSRSIKVWSLPALPPPRTIQAANQGGSGVAISPDGKTIATAANELHRAISLQDLHTGQRTRTLKADQDDLNQLSYSTIDFSPNGKLLIASVNNFFTAGFDVWNLQTGTRIFQLTATRDINNTMGPLSIAISPDSRILVVGNGEMLQLWDLTTGKRTNTLRGHRARVSAIAFSPDGKTLISGDDKGEIKIWSLQ